MSDTNPIVWLITLLFLGAVGVLLIMNAPKASQSFGSVFDITNSWSKTLAGGKP